MAYKMYGKSPMTKKLVGKQENLPEALKAEIRKAPESPMNMYKDSPMDKYASDAQRKAIHASKAEKKSSMKKRGCKSAYKMKPCPGCKKMCPGCKGKKY